MNKKYAIKCNNINEVKLIENNLFEKGYKWAFEGSFEEIYNNNNNNNNNKCTIIVIYVNNKKTHLEWDYIKNNYYSITIEAKILLREAKLNRINK